jgi:DNA-binding PadR family transcriptional regulator
MNVNERLVTSTVVDALGRNGALYVNDLYKSVHKMHSGTEKGAFEEILMLMELQGLIRVYKMPRGKRKAELTKG